MLNELYHDNLSDTMPSNTGSASPLCIIFNYSIGTTIGIIPSADFLLSWLSPAVTSDRYGTPIGSTFIDVDRCRPIDESFGSSEVSMYFSFMSNVSCSNLTFGVACHLPRLSGYDHYPFSVLQWSFML